MEALSSEDERGEAPCERREAKPTLTQRKLQAPSRTPRGPAQHGRRPTRTPSPRTRPSHSDRETAEDARIERARAKPDHGLASRCLTTRPILRVGGPREAIRVLEAAAPSSSL